MGKFFGSKRVWVIFVDSAQTAALALEGNCAVQQLIPMTNPPIRPKPANEGLSVSIQLAGGGHVPEGFKLILVQADQDGQLPSEYRNRVAGAQCLLISAEIPFSEADGKS
jgi:hypothetical protein